MDGGVLEGACGHTTRTSVQAFFRREGGRARTTQDEPLEYLAGSHDVQLCVSEEAT